MTKAEFKKGIKEVMQRYSMTLDQAAWSVKQLNPDWIMLINEAELELTTESLLKARA